MIPRANITAWRSHAPWPSNEQVEQDLVLSRALVAMFTAETVTNQAVFRGGTALHKLFIGTGRRYSEDIDLVQRDAGRIGELIDTIRDALDPWLGNPTWKQGQGRFTLVYRFETTFPPVSAMRLKIEINTREHFSVPPIAQRPFAVANPWFSGSVALPVYQLDELLATKMRALYQRKKGRDLFDLWVALPAGRNRHERSHRRMLSALHGSRRSDGLASRVRSESGSEAQNRGLSGRRLAPCFGRHDLRPNGSGRTRSRRVDLEVARKAAERAVSS